ncbi:MAG: hypothetical protein IRZ05_05780 [Micromonosporaceae bacterium]|jgi:hypothetical protein|nr:hypothetical protein [Micromonosporaceae bacterium]
MDPVVAALTGHPGVAEVAVVRTGTSSVVAVVPDGHCTAVDIRDHLWDALPAGQLPDRVFVVDRLPRDQHGAVLTDQVVCDALADPGACGFAAARSPVEVDLVVLWQEVLGRRHVAAEDSFFALGGDATTAALLLERTNERFGIRMSFAELLERPSLRHVAAAIEDAQVWGEVTVDR